MRTDNPPKMPAPNHNPREPATAEDPSREWIEAFTEWATTAPAENRWDTLRAFAAGWDAATLRAERIAMETVTTDTMSREQLASFKPVGFCWKADEKLSSVCALFEGHEGECGWDFKSGPCGCKAPCTC